MDLNNTDDSLNNIDVFKELMSTNDSNNIDNNSGRSNIIQEKLLQVCNDESFFIYTFNILITIAILFVLFKDDLPFML